jgi:hypothetical protein
MLENHPRYISGESFEHGEKPTKGCVYVSLIFPLRLTKNREDLL